MRRFLPAVFLVAAVPALAQQQPLKLEPLPEPPPSAIGFDQSTDQGVTIAPREGRVEEILTPEGFKVIRVTTPEGLEYVLQEDQGDGSFARQNSGDTGVRAPQWVIFRF
ncbi:MAG: DUF2782 domain-containing protein [Burkholderiales bacterium]|jgi:hypothetical protein|nr:DUF2782 domain-containing protein [Burkholderiales bacterium]